VTPASFIRAGAAGAGSHQLDDGAGLQQAVIRPVPAEPSQAIDGPELRPLEVGGEGFERREVGKIRGGLVRLRCHVAILVV
jgi:hypothetical protein